MKISTQQARNYLVRYQGLTDDTALRDKSGIMDYLTKVGCIQYDPLNIIGRNADLVLQSRIADYDTTMLDTLLYKDRQLVDGWDKMMAIYPTVDFPYFCYVREKRSQGAINILRHRQSQEALDYVDEVIKAITDRGAMQPREIKLGTVSSGTWRHSNMSSATMDYLFHLGKLGVARKENVNKVYDLIERLLPSEILSQPNPFESKDNFIEWYVCRRIAGIGMLWNREGGGWLASCLGDKTVRQNAIDRAVERGKLAIVEIEGIKEPFYINSANLELLSNYKPITSDTIRFIAPLDNMIWDRDMTARLFGFKYTWEVYVPESKRKYGYYVIPLLQGDKLIGRIEMATDRKNKVLNVKNIWWEDPDTQPKEQIDLALTRFAKFQSCNSIVWQK